MALSITKYNLTIRPLLKSINVTAFHVHRNSGHLRPGMGLKKIVSQLEINEDSFLTEEKNEPQGKLLSSYIKRYLAKSKEQSDFMKKEKIEYELGLRHLANIMGKDVKAMKKTDIQKSIEYLFPSGLYDKRARPVLEDPELLYPAQKAPQFDISGRPHHVFFYTATPNFYKMLHDATAHFQYLDNLEDEQAARKIPPAASDGINTEDIMALSKKDLESLLQEVITEKQHEYFVATMERLAEHPYAGHVNHFVKRYTQPKSITTTTFHCLPVRYDQNKRPYVRVKRCMRKSARGHVIVYGEGSGNIEINGQNIHYFKEQHHREQIIFPLIFTGLGDKVDIVANVQGGGPTGQVGAIRWGIAQGLLSFVDQDMKFKLKLAGLLTRDWRRRERKKVGQEGARRKFTWKKR